MIGRPNSYTVVNGVGAQVCPITNEVTRGA